MEGAMDAEGLLTADAANRPFMPAEWYREELNMIAEG